MGIGPLEIGIVLLIVLVIFGPKRLPELGKSLGSGMKSFKDSVVRRRRRQEDHHRRHEVGHDRARREVRDLGLAGRPCPRLGTRTPVARFRPIDHEERLALVDHLGELRSRLIISVIAFGIAFGVLLAGRTS